MSMDLDVNGISELEAQFKNYESNAAQALGAALHAQGLKIMREAKRMVPVDTGRLRQSGFVSSPTKDGDRAVVVIGFGAEYALAVHEAPGTLLGESEPRSSGRGFHWDPQGQAQPKFLEKAIDEHRDQFDDEVLALFERFLETGVGIQIIETPSEMQP